MTEIEADDVLAMLDAGSTLEVPLQTPLFPETEAIRSTLHRSDGGVFVLCTHFREFAAGHGWSCEQTEDEVLDRATLRARLVHAARAAFVAR